MKSTYKILVERSEGKRQLGRPRHRPEDTIKIILKLIVMCRLDYAGSRMYVVAGFCSTIMHLRCPWIRAIFWPADESHLSEKDSAPLRFFTPSSGYWKTS
jgi:hypothetical protein